MSIVSVTKVWSGETTSDSFEGGREYEELYRVISDDPEESPITVRNAMGIPPLFSQFPGDTAAFCRGRTTRRLDSTRLVWEVTARFEWSPIEIDENPIASQVRIRWAAQQYVKPIFKGRAGEAILNSAGDYFDPPPEIEDVRWVVSIQANLSFVPTAIISFANAINSSAFVVDGISVAQHTARVIGLDISEWQEQNDIPFRTVSFGIEIRPEGFNLSLLDQGYRIKEAGELKDILIEDENGTENRPTSPLLLNGSGGLLENPSPSSAVFINYDHPAPLLDFTTLPGITSS